jgi:hypothetical protein
MESKQLKMESVALPTAIKKPTLSLYTVVCNLHLHLLEQQQLEMSFFLVPYIIIASLCLSLQMDMHTFSEKMHVAPYVSTLSLILFVPPLV